MVSRPRAPTGKGFPYGGPASTSVFAMAQKKKTTKKSTSTKKPAASAAPKVEATPKVEAPKPVSIPSTPPPAPFSAPKKKKNFLRRLLGF